MSDTLAPCPFCGHEGNIVTGEPGFYEILCAGCDHACFAYFHTRTMATAAWNTRTAPVEVQPVETEQYPDDWGPMVPTVPLPDDYTPTILAALRTKPDAQGDVREALAEYAHEAWSGWMKYMFEKGHIHDTGICVLPHWAVKRWTRQMNTPYADLPESEKESDRLEADRMLAIVQRPAAAAGA